MVSRPLIERVPPRGTLWRGLHCPTSIKVCEPTGRISRATVGGRTLVIESAQAPGSSGAVAVAFSRSPIVCLHARRSSVELDRDFVLIRSAERSRSCGCVAHKPEIAHMDPQRALTSLLTQEELIPGNSPSGTTSLDPPAEPCRHLFIPLSPPRRVLQDEV